MPPTAPKWAQAIGLRTRNQALQWQARNSGYANRPEFERQRARIVTLGPAHARRWREWQLANRIAEIERTQKAIAKAHATRRDLNNALPEGLRQQSPKAR